jgi:archaellum biogenesis ATPase FlaH
VDAQRGPALGFEFIGTGGWVDRRGERVIHHTKSTRCRVCGGASADPQGKGIRCFGFTSDDGQWIRCTRENFAGSLAREEKTQAFVHRFGGPCNCGIEHAPANGNGNGHHKPIVLATYEYRDEKDRPLYRVLRFLPKDFRPERWDAKSHEWVGGSGCMEGVRRVPYRLPEILETPQDQPILIVDGEKDVDTAWAIGQPATCAAGGMKWTPELVATLGGRPVTIVADRDGGRGKEQAGNVARILETAKVKHRVIELPGEGVKDLTDWVHKAGGTSQNLKNLVSHGTPKSFDEITGSESKGLDQFTHLIDTKIEYTIYPICPKGTLTLVQGQPKGGKSTFTSWLATCAAMGFWNSDIIKIEKPIKTLFVEYEDDVLLVVQRIASYLEGAGLDRYELPKNFIYCESPTLWLDSPSYEGALIQEIKEKGYELVVIDTLSDIHNAEDENASAQMKLVMKALKRIAKETQCSIILIHHSKKGSDGASISERARGSSVISAKADVFIDWGDRGDSDITPVRIGGKYGFKAKCEVEYVRKDGRAVEWILRSLEPKQSKMDQKIENVFAVVRELNVDNPNGTSGAQIALVMKDQGVSQPATYRYLDQLVDQQRISKRVSGKFTLYSILTV